MAKKQELESKIKSLVSDRKRAYCQTFGGDSEAVKAVLVDLAFFCRANQTTFHEDPRAHALLEGRREVYLRIKQHLELSDDELFELLK